MKRFFDILLSAVALLILAIPLLIIMALIKFDSKGPALYWSKRVGRNGHIFNMPKLRTMALNTPVLPTHEFRNAETFITTLGKFLRRSSIDELPQLHSVLVGYMSVVVRVPDPTIRRIGSP